MTYELILPPTVDSVGKGRRLVNDALTEWHLDGLAYTATLLTSEVLTNSILHARTPMRLTVERQAEQTVVISVHDGSKVVPRRRRHAADATTGRGIDLLERLSTTWRVEPQDDGKTLTFTVGTDRDPWAAYAGTDWTDVEL